MAAEEVEPSEAGAEVSLVIDEEGFLVAGEPAAVDHYVAQFQEFSRSLGQPDLTPQRLSDIASAVTALHALQATSGTYFTMSQESLKLYQAGKAMPSSVGYFRGVFLGDRGITNLANFREVSLVGSQAVSVQLMLATMALRLAMRDIQTAVARVEGKVDDLVELTRARTIANVVRQHGLLAEYVERVDRSGVLPEVDWLSIDDLGPHLAAGVLELRLWALSHIRNLPPPRTTKERIRQLRQLAEESRLGEVLQLLAIAEDSHYLWQFLRIERSRTTDPEHVGEIIESARRQLHEDLDGDRSLALELQGWLIEHGTPKPQEFHLTGNWRKLESDVTLLRQQLDQFAEIRQIEIEAWPNFELPTLKGAGIAMARRGKELGVAVGEFSDVASERTRNAVDALRGRPVRESKEPLTSLEDSDTQEISRSSDQESGAEHSSDSETEEDAY